MSNPAARSLSDPVAEAHALADTLRERADEIEGARRMPLDLAERFAEAGFYRLCVPEVYGGLEQPPMVLIETVEALARADGSAAWVAFIGATSGSAMAYLPAAGLDKDAVLAWVVLYYGPRKEYSFKLRIRISQDGRVLHDEIMAEGKVPKRKVKQVSGQVDVQT